MSYRKLNVNGVEYRYVIGKKLLKLQKMGDKKFELIPNEKIGNQLYNTEIFVVTPGVIRDFILGNQLPQEFHCNRHDVTTSHLAYNPFDSEIYGKHHLMMDCPECRHNLEMDI